MNFVEAVGWTFLGAVAFLALLALGARIYYEIDLEEGLGIATSAVLIAGIPILIVTPLALSGLLG